MSPRLLPLVMPLTLLLPGAHALGDATAPEDDWVPADLSAAWETPPAPVAPEDLPASPPDGDGEFLLDSIHAQGDGAKVFAGDLVSAPDAGFLEPALRSLLRSLPADRETTSQDYPYCDPMRPYVPPTPHDNCLWPLPIAPPPL